MLLLYFTLIFSVNFPTGGSKGCGTLSVPCRDAASSQGLQCGAMARAAALCQGYSREAWPCPWSGALRSLLRKQQGKGEPGNATELEEKLRIDFLSGALSELVRHLLASSAQPDSCSLC